MDAELLLFQMIDQYQKDNIIDHRPNAASIISIILLWKDSICANNKRRKSDETTSLSMEEVSINATERSTQLLELLTEMYKLEKRAHKNVDDLKPDVRVYNAVQGVNMRSKVKKAMTKELPARTC